MRANPADGIESVLESQTPTDGIGEADYITRERALLETAMCPYLLGEFNFGERPRRADPAERDLGTGRCSGGAGGLPPKKIKGQDNPCP